MFIAIVVKYSLYPAFFGDTDRLVGNREEETPEDFLLEEAVSRGAYLSDVESRCVLLERKQRYAILYSKMLLRGMLDFKFVQVALWT